MVGKDTLFEALRGCSFFCWGGGDDIVVVVVVIVVLLPESFLVGMEAGASFDIVGADTDLAGAGPGVTLVLGLGGGVVA